jgi:hypothetical protein
MKTDGLECYNHDCHYRDISFEFSCSKDEEPQPLECLGFQPWPTMRPADVEEP